MGFANNAYVPALYNYAAATPFYQRFNSVLLDLEFRYTKSKQQGIKGLLNVGLPGPVA